MKWCFGICWWFGVKNVTLVNFISSLYTAPVKVDGCLQNEHQSKVWTHLFFIINNVYIFRIVKSTMKKQMELYNDKNIFYFKAGIRYKTEQSHTLVD